MTGSATGRTVLVTGGSRGIGAAIAKKLASIGMNVVVNYASREDDAAQITKEVAAINGGGAIAAKGDVSRSDESATSARMRWSATATAWPPQAGRTSSSAPATRRTRWPTQSGGFGRTAGSSSWAPRPSRSRFRRSTS